MNNFARIDSDTVVEVVALPDGLGPADFFAPELAETFVPCPDEVEDQWSYVDGVFKAPTEVVPTLDAAKADRIETLRLACETTITGGFKSSALGNAHTYPSDINAQINLMGSVTDSIMPGLPANWTTPFWVCDAAGVWAWKMHNAAQIQQAGRDGKAHVVSCQTLLAELTAAVLAAAAAEAVASITWPEGAGA